MAGILLDLFRLSGISVSMVRLWNCPRMSRPTVRKFMPDTTMSSSLAADGSRITPVLSVVVPCYNERPNVAPMIAKLDAALSGIAWEVIYVDDNSPDGTAQEVRRIAGLDPRVRCIRRVGRRGLASAVIEGALSSSADYVAVIDGDLQHDETRLPVMLAALQAGGYDIAVASRHVEGGDNAGLSGRFRRLLSDGGIRLAQVFMPVRLSDPMSGFFMLPRPLFEDLASGLNGQGFKILLDLILSSSAPLRVLEVPARFRERLAAGQGVRRAAAVALLLVRPGRCAGCRRAPVRVGAAGRRDDDAV
jgi:dolichol-phosphate mannosyltransferase